MLAVVTKNKPVSLDFVQMRTDEFAVCKESMKKIEELHGMNSKSYRVELENKCKEYFSFLSSTHGEVHQTIYFGKVIRSDLGREYLVAVKKLLGDLRWEQDRVQRTYRHLLSTKSVTDLVTV